MKQTYFIILVILSIVIASFSVYTVYYVMKKGKEEEGFLGSILSWGKKKKEDVTDKGKNIWEMITGEETTKENAVPYEPWDAQKAYSHGSGPDLQFLAFSST